jgi:hypothetical protein
MTIDWPRVSASRASGPRCDARWMSRTPRCARRSARPLRCAGRYLPARVCQDAMPAWGRSCRTRSKRPRRPCSGGPHRHAAQRLPGGSLRTFRHPRPERRWSCRLLPLTVVFRRLRLGGTPLPEVFDFRPASSQEVALLSHPSHPARSILPYLGGTNPNLGGTGGT